MGHAGVGWKWVMQGWGGPCRGGVGGPCRVGVGWGVSMQAWGGVGGSCRVGVGVGHVGVGWVM